VIQRSPAVHGIWFLIAHLMSSLFSMLNLQVLRGIAYNSSTRGKCADTKKSETTENCEAGNCGSTNIHTTEIIDDVSKKNTEVENDKKVSFDNVTGED